MKNTRLLFCMLVGLLIFSPVFADALTEDEAKKIMEDLPIVEKDGKCTFTTNTISYEDMIKNSCGFTYDEYALKHPFKDTYSKEKLEEAYNNDVNKCKMNFANRMFNHYSKDVFFMYNEDDKTINISIQYDGGSLSKNCNIEYADYDEDYLDAAKEIDKKLDYSYTLYGYDVINSFYHYGPINSKTLESKTFVYRFPKIKDVLLDNPEFDYDSSMGGAVGGFHSMTNGFIKIFKDDVLYGMHYLDANYYGILLVDKDEEGTTLEKAKKALNTYFGDKVEYSFDEDNVYGIDDSGFDIPNKAFGTTGVQYDGIDVMLTLPSGQFNIGVSEMDKDDIKEFEVYAKDKGTGVYVESNSYEVPSDVTLDVDDVTDKISKKFDKEMYKVHSAYDIEVIKMADGGFVETIENGIDVYIPISGRTVGEEMKVYHITENGKGDGYKGVVVEVEGKQYVKFTTTHFSTYAIVEELNSTGGPGEAEPEKNPNTFDGIGNSLITLLVSIITLGGCILYKKKCN